MASTAAGHSGENCAQYRALGRSSPLTPSRCIEVPADIRAYGGEEPLVAEALIEPVTAWAVLHWTLQLGQDQLHRFDVEVIEHVAVAFIAPSEKHSAFAKNIGASNR